MQITVLFFATLKDLVGQSKLTFTLDSSTATVEAVRVSLADQYPQAAANLQSAVCAINEEFAFTTDTVKDGDTVAFSHPLAAVNKARKSSNLPKTP